jgi:hypothetical protein
VSASWPTILDDMTDLETSRTSVRSLVIDGSIISGSALVSVGAGLVYMPAGLISAGVLLLAMGLNAAKKHGGRG